MIFTPRGHRKYLEAFLVISTGKLLLLCSELRLGTLLNILECTGPPSPRDCPPLVTKEDLAQTLIVLRLSHPE